MKIIFHFYQFGWKTQSASTPGPMGIQFCSSAALGQEDSGEVRVSGLEGCVCSILLDGTSSLFFRWTIGCVF